MRVLATAVALVLLAAASAQAQPKVLRYTPAADLTSLDAQTNTALVTAQYGMMVYDTLFSFDIGMQPKPQMVDKWTVSEDQLAWSFTLRPGLKFHDGAPVTAKDVKWSFDRAVTVGGFPTFQMSAGSLEKRVSPPGITR